MIDYLYDGSFEGFLTCIYLHYYEEKAAGIFTESNYQPNMLHSFKSAHTNSTQASTVYDAIAKKISPYDLQRIYKVFLSSSDNKESLLLNYIRFGFKTGSKTSLLHGNPYVSPVEKLERTVSNEIHRLLGLLRFSVLETGLLYAVLEPDHDILEFLAEHFSDRYKNEPFIIHDKRREKALIAHQKQWYITDFDDSMIPRLSDDEKDYRALWQKYFESIAIKERINPRCQKNFMPVRYWKHLTEITYP